MESNRYHTVGREKLLAYFAAHPDRSLTVEEIIHALASEQVVLGKSTAYRLLGRLCEEGKLQQTRDGSRGCRLYAYAADTHGCDGRHFHLKCLCCGRIFHLDCRQSDALCDHIAQAHRFRIDNAQTVLYGHCESCCRAAQTL